MMIAGCSWPRYWGVGNGPSRCMQVNITCQFRGDLFWAFSKPRGVVISIFQPHLRFQNILSNRQSMMEKTKESIQRLFMKLFLVFCKLVYLHSPFCLSYAQVWVLNSWNKCIIFSCCFLVTDYSEERERNIFYSWKEKHR